MEDGGEWRPSSLFGNAAPADPTQWYADSMSCCARRKGRHFNNTRTRAYGTRASASSSAPPTSCGIDTTSIAAPLSAVAQRQHGVEAVSFITEENWGVVKLPVCIECVFTGMLLFWNDGT